MGVEQRRYLLLDHFGRDVVRGSEFLGHLPFVGLVGERSAEVDDFQLFEVLGGLEQHVFGLEVPVHDGLLVAVVDGREQLLHNQADLLLRELLGFVLVFDALQDLVEQFAALTDLGYDVEPLLVLQKLVYLYDVRVVLRVIRLHVCLPYL